jgi:chromosome segregation ATPase
MIDELENRVRELASEVEGEKAVTRQVYQQAVRNGDALRAVQLSIVEITSRVDHVVQEVITNTAAVRSHGARLDSLTRDVGLLRNDQVQMRREIEELRAHIEELRTPIEELRVPIDELRAQSDELRAHSEELRTHIDVRFDAVLEAIRAPRPGE